MSLSEQLTKLKQARSDIKQALEVKLRSGGGGTSVPDSLRFNELAAYIERLETGKAITIVVTAPDFEGETLTATKGSKKFTGKVNEGIANIKVDDGGIWEISSGEYSTQIEINVKFEWETNLNKAKIYTFAVSTESDPDKRVTYRDDAVGMEPAKMESSVFNWGDWKDVFFNQKNHVYRMKRDGTIVGQCKDDDYSQFIDGSNSGLDGTGHTDNFMASIPTCWVWRRMEGTTRVISISNVKVDENYKAYAHTAEDGQVQDFIYWGAFMSTLEGSTLRSIASANGMYGGANNISTKETYCKNNGSRWFYFDWADMQLRNDLLTLMFKSTNIQGRLGKGGNLMDSPKPGEMKNRGAFYSDNRRVKAFHVEDFWGQTVRYLIAGILVTSANVKVKMTRPYNLTGSGYTSFWTSTTPSSFYYNNGVKVSENGLYPTTFSGGSSTTYECANMWAYTNSGLTFATSVGTSSIEGSPFSFVIASNTSSSTNNYEGMLLSYK